MRRTLPLMQTVCTVVEIHHGTMQYLHRIVRIGGSRWGWACLNYPRRNQWFSYNYLMLKLSVVCLQQVHKLFQNTNIKEVTVASLHHLPVSSASLFIKVYVSAPKNARWGNSRARWHIAGYVPGWFNLFSCIAICDFSCIVWPVSPAVHVK